MLFILKINLFCLLFLIFIPYNASSISFHTTPDKWKEPRKVFDVFEKDFDGRIKISRIKKDTYIKGVNENNRKYSLNNIYWFAIDPVDTTKPSPWSTQIRVFNERDYLICISIIDYAAQYDLKINWINEKMIYAQFWWGRIVGSFFIFDVEKEKILIKEMFYEGSHIFHQWQTQQDKQ